MIIYTYYNYDLFTKDFNKYFYYNYIQIFKNLNFFLKTEANAVLSLSMETPPPDACDMVIKHVVTYI